MADYQEDWQEEYASREYSYKESDRGRHRESDYGDDSYDRRERNRSHRESGYDADTPSRRSRDHESGRHRSHDRDRDRERSRDREHRYHGDRDRDRSRDRHRHRYEDDDEYDRERRHRRSRSRARSRDRARSRSRSRDKRSKRASGFDMAPTSATVVPGAPIQGVAAVVSQPMQLAMAGAFPFAGAQLGALSTVPLQAMTQQAMRHARRVYVGGLPPYANEQAISTFFNQVMHAIGGNSAPGDAVVNVYINHEKKFSFVEMRTVEEASNAMALDGILFEGMPVRVRRPSDYNPTLAATLGPSQPNPNLNLAAVGLTPGIIGGAEGPDKIFVGGLPYYLTEAQIKELLESFGALRGFDLVKDRETGNSKGYAFCVYQDPAVTDVACAALNGLKMGDKTLTVRRATLGSQPKPDQANVFYEAQQQIAMQKLVWQSTGSMLGMGNGVSQGEMATKVLCLTNLVSVDELRDDQEYDDIYQDIKEECSKFGAVAKLMVPRPGPGIDSGVPGLGKAFVEYTDTQGSSKARASLNGRKFGGNTVLAVYYPEDKFAREELEA